MNIFKLTWLKGMVTIILAILLYWYSKKSIVIGENQSATLYILMILSYLLILYLIIMVIYTLISKNKRFPKV